MIENQSSQQSQMPQGVIKIVPIERERKQENKTKNQVDTGSVSTKIVSQFQSGDHGNQKHNLLVLGDNTLATSGRGIQTNGQLNSLQSEKMINTQANQISIQSNVLLQINQNNSQDSSQVTDFSIGLVFLLAFLTWIGLGLFAIIYGDTFANVERINDLKKDSISSGLYCVILSALIAIVLGSLLQYLLFKNSYRTLVTCIILSILFIIGLAIYAFYEGFIAVGVVAVIFSVFITGLCLTLTESLSSYAKISEICFLYKIVEKKNLILLFLFSFSILIEMAFSLISLVNIFFSLSQSIDHQGEYVFFAVIFSYISSWIIDTTISVYNFIISRKCSYWYFNSSHQNHDLESGEHIKTPSLQITTHNNINKENTPKNSAQKNQRDINIGATSCNPQTEHVNKSKESDLDDKNVSRKMQIKSNQNSNQSENISNEMKETESIRRSLKIAFLKIGSICYGNLINQLFNLGYMIIYLILICTTLIFFMSGYNNSIRNYTMKMKVQLCLIRLAYDAKDYCQSLDLLGAIIQKQSYVYFYAMWGINEISNINQLFCFTSGFVVGLAIIADLNFSKWYFTFLFIILIFIITLQTSKFMIANFQMIVYSLATFQEIEKAKKPKQFSEKYKQIQNILLEAYKLQKEKLKIEQLY